MGISYHKLLQYALRLIVKKRYTEYEMRRRLQRVLGRWRGEAIEAALGEAMVEKVMVRLKELAYIDDTRFAQDYISDKLRFAPRGLRMIEQELRKKGVTREIVMGVTQDGGIDELEVARAVLAKYWRRVQGLEVRAQRERVFRYLASRGFAPDTIYKVVEAHYTAGADKDL